MSDAPAQWQNVQITKLETAFDAIGPFHGANLSK